jgi:hypothetical protein
MVKVTVDGYLFSYLSGPLKPGVANPLPTGIILLLMPLDNAL